MSETAASSTFRRWWPFVCLCVFTAVRWSVGESVPASLPSLWSTALGCLTACLIALTVATLRHEPKLLLRDGLASFAAGSLMLGGPLLGVLLGTRFIDASALTLALALVPVVVAVARPAFHRGDRQELAGRLWPGIAAVAGMLLLLPQPALSGALPWIALGAAPIMAGVGAMWLRTRAGSASWRAALALAAGMLVAVAVAFVRHLPVSHATLLASAFDAATAGLTVLTLFRVGGTRWSAQFVLVPLVVIAEGVLLLRPHLDPRTIAGLALMLFAAVFLLLPPKMDDAEFGVPVSDE
ncbi:hypothetical protein ACFQBQ_01645 [Granulicella cerasi]|uniref:EamA-like transporter family protein n=1 Tax=Granulicella cerasi TaxID=741063 RepID=A0ABW1Z5B9_9BACT|nr:hypothetical protein [Granulicella cerasi]